MRINKIPLTAGLCEVATISEPSNSLTENEVMKKMLSSQKKTGNFAKPLLAVRYFFGCRFIVKYCCARI